jgi:hypothetical protein
MKVIGTGAPEVLTISFTRCELDVLRDELHQLRAVYVEAAHIAHRRDDAGQVKDPEVVPHHHEELVEISQVFDWLARVSDEEDEPEPISGPNWFWARVLRGASADAAARLLDAIERYQDKSRHCSPAELAREVASASAWAETLMAHHHVDNHGLESWR